MITEERKQQLDEMLKKGGAGFQVYTYEMRNSESLSHVSKFTVINIKCIEGDYKYLSELNHIEIWYALDRLFKASDFITIFEVSDTVEDTIDITAVNHISKTAIKNIRMYGIYSD